MCDVQKSIRYCGNTTNLNCHLKQNHPEEDGCTTANQGTSMASKNSDSEHQLIIMVEKHHTSATHSNMKLVKILFCIYLFRFSANLHCKSESFLRYSTTLDPLLPGSFLCTFHPCRYTQ